VRDVPDPTIDAPCDIFFYNYSEIGNLMLILLLEIDVFGLPCQRRYIGHQRRDNVFSLEIMELSCSCMNE
jgi:hypothetical protein